MTGPGGSRERGPEKEEARSGRQARWWLAPGAGAPGLAREAVVDCAWGRVIFAQTFSDADRLAQVLAEEEEGRRDIAFYLSDPHVLVARQPQELFIDPSHTFHLDLSRYAPPEREAAGFSARPVASRQECDAVHALYRVRQMVPPLGEDVWELRSDKRVTWFVAVEDGTGRVLGVVLGIDHVEAFGDPEGGASLWSLAVDPQASYPGIGQALVHAHLSHYQELGRRYVDLSVMHDNTEAIALYEKLGFERVPVFAVKRKNPINEPLFTAHDPASGLNPYARLITDEARRRGIGVEVLDAEAAYFRLTMGGRSVVCRESLTELTSAIAMSRCDDKVITLRVLREAGIRVPDQAVAPARAEREEFLRRHGRIVVKPRRGEQGAGVTVDVRSVEDMEQAVRRARATGGDLLLEQFCEGQDLRIVLIDYKVVAAAVRRPAEITGTGRHPVRELIRRQSRRRAAATGGESRIPMDPQTRSCVSEAGIDLDTVLPEGEVVRVRKTANLHTGGTIHDVTDTLHPRLAEVARAAARVLEIPVVGLDLLVPSVEGPDYVVVEANERPGLANHEPQPTAERFVDFLFPQTRIA